MIVKRRIVAVVVGLLVLVGARPAMAQSKFNKDCETDFGTRTPILMIHGWHSDKDMWGSGTKPGTMYAALQEGKGILLDLFDYKDFHFEWVTNSNIGPALAKRIDCLAQNSLAGKGKGKVIVIAHSMGGLATRFALNQTIDGRKVADEAGLVVTIGTPEEGAFIANLCDRLAKMSVSPSDCQGSAVKALMPGSKELAELPPFPPLVPVKAIAGDVALNESVTWSSFKPVPTPTGSDLVVAVSSAVKYATTIGNGDGVRKFDCSGWNPIPGKSDAPCEHNNLVKMPEVQEEVKKSIDKYIASLQPPLSPAVNFFGLQLHLGPEWHVLTADEDLFTSYRKTVVNAKCHAAGKFYCPGFVVARTNGADPKVPYKQGVQCNYDQVHDDLGWSPPQMLEKLTFAGMTAQHFTQKNNCKLEDNEPIARKGDVLHGWRFLTKDLVVYDTEGTTEFSSDPVPGVLQLLQTASWQ